MGIFSDIFDFVGDIFNEVVSWFVDIPDVPEYENAAQGALVNKQSNLAQIPVIYGRRLVGGTRVFVETSGTDNEYLYIALVLCEGEIESIGDVYINDVISTDSKFSGLVSIDKKLGSDTQTASSVLTAAPSWTSSHTLKGVAYLGLRFKWDRDVFGSIPDVTAVVRGRKVYDPRTGTTAYRTNPALCLLDYLRNSRYGKGLASTDFESDYASWKNAANICDTNVTAYTGGTTIDLFSCNTVIDVSKPIIDNVKILLSGMQGLLSYTQGYYRLIVEDTASSVFSFTEDNILSGITVNGEKKRERYNRVIATFPNPAKNWQQDQVEYPEAGSSTYTTLLAEDGGLELERRMSLDTVTSVYQARNIAYTALYKSRNGIRCSFVATIASLNVMVGDVVTVTHSSFGWSAKPFRVVGITLQIDGNVGVSLVEYQESIYPWLEDAQVPDYPDTNLPNPFAVQSVNNATISVTSDEAISDNGNSVQRFLIDWTEPNDNFISDYIVQYRVNGTSAWSDEIKTDAPPIYAANVISGEDYDVRIKAVNTLGVSSAWAQTASAVTAAALTSRSGVKTFRQNDAPTSGIQTGDIWFDTNDDNKPYRYNGSTWDSVRDATIADAFAAAQSAEAIADGKINAYYQASQPTGADTGDMWVDTDNGNKAYYYNGTSWVGIQDSDIADALADAANAQSTADGKITAFYQTTQPTSGMSEGDMWYDTDDDNHPYYYTGSAWTSIRDATIATAIQAAADAQATADGKITAYYQNTAPTGADTGDMWVDTDDKNRAYRYTGSSWSEITNTDIAQALSNAATAQSTADGKIESFYQTSAPTAAAVGDLWFDTNDDNKPYRWSGSSWVSVRDGTIADAITAAAGAQATADGKVTTFYQNDAPTADGVGDLWIDTNDNNKLYRWSGSAWTNVQDGQIGTAISDAATAQATADGKIVSFYQNNAPTAAAVGDIWFETDNNNKVYRWSGSAWVAQSGNLFDKDNVSENEISLNNNYLSAITANMGTITAGKLQNADQTFVIDLALKKIYIA
jgi:hypothetical protein